MFEDARAYPVLDVLAVAAFEHDAVDALQMQQVGEEQPGRARADDPYLGTHVTSGRLEVPSSVLCRGAASRLDFR